MKLFDVYPLNPIEIVKANGSSVWDSNGNEYLDLYGGHAVISIGHTHPHYVRRISDQLNKVAFYSNSVIIALQQELAEKLGVYSYENYDATTTTFCGTVLGASPLTCVKRGTCTSFLR